MPDSHPSARLPYLRWRALSLAYVAVVTVVVPACVRTPAPPLSQEGLSAFNRLLRMRVSGEPGMNENMYDVGGEEWFDDQIRQAIKREGEPLVAVARARAESPDPVESRLAAHMLVLASDPHARRYVLEALKSQDFPTLYWGTDAARRLGDRSLEPVLLSILTDDTKVHDARAYAAWALETTGGKDAVEPLLAVALAPPSRSGEAGLCYHAMDTLALIGGERAREELVGLVRRNWGGRSDPWWVSYALKTVLTRWGDVRVKDALLGVLHEAEDAPSRMIRCGHLRFSEVLYFTGALKLDDAVPALTRVLLYDSWADCQEDIAAARKALAAIRGKPLPEFPPHERASGHYSLEDEDRFTHRVTWEWWCEEGRARYGELDRGRKYDEATAAVNDLVVAASLEQDHYHTQPYRRLLARGDSALPQLVTIFREGRGRHRTEVAWIALLDLTGGSLPAEAREVIETRRHKGWFPSTEYIQAIIKGRTPDPSVGDE